MPAVFYAYPVEFASADTAGQVSGSPHRFTLPAAASHLFFLTQGYAVMEGTGVYLFPEPGVTPPALLANLRNNGVLHETIVLVSVPRS